MQVNKVIIREMNRMTPQNPIIKKYKLQALGESVTSQFEAAGAANKSQIDD